MASTPRPATEVEPGPAVRGRRVGTPLPPLVVLVVGLVVTAVLSWICWTVNDRNETRLLRIQVQQGATVISASIPSIEAPLSSAVDVADATGGDPGKFTSYLAPFVGPGREYASASLLALTPRPRSVTVLGQTPYIGTDSARLHQALTEAARTGGPGLIGILGTRQRRVGYALSGPGSPFAVYAELALPPEEHFTVAPTDVFADLDFAIYLGRAPVAPQLLGASEISDLPLTGRTASSFVAVGDSGILVVGRPTTPLGGGLLNDLWWIVALAGVALTLVATWIAARLARGRGLAERLAVVNRALYGQQRSIAQTLQRALLPEEAPLVPGLESGVRYRPGVQGIDVGGDWCDVVELGPSRVLLVVGDVFGRGLEAATTMASLYYAIRAYAREGHPPGVILDKLSALVRAEGSRRFASVLCALADVGGHRLILANAGHLPPLLVDETGRRFVDTEPGPPLGVEGAAGYAEHVLDVPPGSTLIAYTDGLVERRDEVIDRGLERLSRAVPDPPGSLDECLDEVVAALVPEGAPDDTAILGVRWTR